MSYFNNCVVALCFQAFRGALIYVCVHPSQAASYIQFSKIREPLHSCTFSKSKLHSSGSFSVFPCCCVSHLFSNKAKKKAKISPLSEIFATEFPREELRDLSGTTGLLPPCSFLLPLLHQCPFWGFSCTASFTFFLLNLSHSALFSFRITLSLPRKPDRRSYLGLRPLCFGAEGAGVLLLVCLWFLP